jgi:hypothetical protein
MTKLLEKTKAVRKTFTLPKYLAEELEQYANTHDTKQSQVVADLLDEFFHNTARNQKVQKRLQALESLVGIVPKGSIGDKKIQDFLGMKHA